MSRPTALEVAAAFGANPPAAIESAQILHHAKRAVLDWYAATIPGAVQAPPVLLERVLADELDRGPSALVLGRRATTRAAAFLDGTAAHTVEVDDIFKEAIYHPGAPTIAAARAVAREVEASGLDFLRAITVGYEISTRIGAALGRAHYRYWHNTGTVGSFGAAAAAASLYRLDAKQFAHALATVATFAAGLQQAFRMDSMSKPMHAGRAAQSGVFAAQMAREGVTGSLDVLDGDEGMGRAMSDGPDWSAALHTLGHDFNIAQMTFKNHACCGHTFACIDGALHLRQEMAFDPGQIERIRIATYEPALSVAGNADPRTAAEARFSIAFVVATALIHGRVRLTAFSPERLTDPAIRSLMARIELSVDPRLDAAFPRKRSAEVTVLMRDGSMRSFLQTCRKGDPEAPLTDAELDDKFFELVPPVIGRRDAEQLRARIWSMENLPAVG